MQAGGMGFETGGRVDEFELARQNISFCAPPKPKGKAYEHARRKSTVRRGHVGQPSWMPGYSARALKATGGKNNAETLSPQKSGEDASPTAVRT